MIFAAVLSSASVFAAENSVQFEFTGNIQTWQVPQNVNQVKIEAWGAQGGADGNSGGYGAYAYGFIDVTPGNTLNIYVGGQGSSCAAGSGGGFNGGGNAGPYGCSGGGGGASDVRIGGTDLNNRIIVAGGGGGAGLYGGGGPGGGSGPFLEAGQGGNHPGDGGGGGGGYLGGYYGIYLPYYYTYKYIYIYDIGGLGGSSYTGGVNGGGMTAGIQNGNGRVKITYTLADTTPPTATVIYSKTGPTNQDVVATITPSEPIVGPTSHTFTENGSYTFQFTDLAGNAGSVTATVSNIDKVAPTATVSYSKTDPTNQDVIATITPSESIVGLTSHAFTENGSYTFQFTDLAGNTGSVTAIVSNIDKAAPTLTVKADKASLTPPNHKLVDIGLSWNAHDAGSGIASVKLVSVTSNEPDNGLGDGDTSNDIQSAEFGTADQSIQLRAERSGNGTGRVYTITYVATDLAGNSVTASTTVTVPKSK
jgi:hypothetical protein